MPSPKLRSAHLKIDRAAKHIDELNELLREKRPFTYVVKTDTQAGERATLAKQNKAVVEDAAIISGDALHNLRGSLDHAYWRIVSPVAGDVRGAKAIQFPFSQTAARLEETVQNRLAHKVSSDFFAFIMALRPHGELGGNELLYLLHEHDAVDKHRTLIPMGDYTRLSGDILRKQVPDFPAVIASCAFGQNPRDVVWPLRPDVRSRLGLPGIPLPRVLEQELDVPVQIVLDVGPTGASKPLIATLSQLVRVVRDIVEGMERFA